MLSKIRVWWRGWSPWALRRQKRMLLETNALLAGRLARGEQVTAEQAIYQRGDEKDALRWRLGAEALKRRITDELERRGLLRCVEVIREPLGQEITRVTLKATCSVLPEGEESECAG